MSGESAPYAQFLEQLPATIDRLAGGAGGETEVHLLLKLDLLPAMLQYLLSTGQMSTTTWRINLWSASACSRSTRIA